MRRLAVAVSAAAVIAAATALAVAVAGSQQAASMTSLTIKYWPEGPSAGRAVTWTLRCDPAGGTLRRPGNACTRLKAGGMKLLAPLTLKNVACIQIYGGPEVARVSGKFRSRKVTATYNRRDGCQISRWNKLAPWLLPPGGA